MVDHKTCFTSYYNMTQKELNARCYRNRKDHGLCQRCGNVLDGTNKSYCTKCVEKVRKYQRKNRQFYISIGICPVCKKNQLFGDEKSCPECKAKRMKYKTSTDKYRERNRIKSKEIHLKCIETGTCTRCRKRKAVYNRKKCEICLEKDRVYQALRRK